MTLYEIDILHGTLTPWDVPLEKAKQHGNVLEFTDSQGVVRRLYNWVFANIEWHAVRAAKEVSNAEADRLYIQSSRLTNQQFKIQPVKS